MPKTYYRWIPPAVFIVCCLLAFELRFLFYWLTLRNFEHIPSLILALGLTTGVIAARAKVDLAEVDPLDVGKLVLDEMRQATDAAR